MTTGLRAWTGAHPRAVDAAIALVVLVLSLLAVPATPETVGFQPPELSPAVIALVVVACGALVVRRTHPLTAWGVSLVAAAVPLPDGSLGRGLPAAIAALYAVAAYRGRRAGVLAALLTMVVTILLLVRSGLVDARDPVAYAVVAWCGLAAALGDAVRSNRAVLAAALDRARRAEEGRDEEARRRVAEERLRISRELHDVVAHHLAVVTVQAGVAEHLAATSPGAATEALARVRDASGEALREMGDLVGLLRTGADEDGSTASPAPTAADLPALVESARTRGLDVTWRHDGPPLGGTAGDDLHLYRIVQEALTNAARHGTGRALLTTARRADEVEVEVVNDIADAERVDRAAARRDGHGLVGMRERVALVGGRLDAGPLSGSRFRVHAVLPVRSTE